VRVVTRESDSSQAVCAAAVVASDKAVLVRRYDGTADVVPRACGEGRS
jgi:hypothetical protein